MDDSFLAAVERNRRLLAIVLLAFFLYQGVNLINMWSPTGEERLTVGTGLIHFKRGICNGPNPPLLQTLLAAPYAFGLDQFEIFTNSPPNTARYVNLLLSLFCGVALYLLCERKIGGLSGVFALLLYCFSPNVLTHSALATIDMGSGLLALLFIFAFERSWQNNSPKGELLAGVVLGLLLSAKFSNMAFVIFVFVLAAFKLYSKEVHWQRVARHTAVVLASAWFIFSLIYGFQGVFQIKGAMRHAPNLTYLSPLLPTRAYAALGETFTKQNMASPPYIAGNRAAWTRSYYYPIVFLFKTPLGTLLLLIVLLANFPTLWREKKNDLMWLLMPPLIFFATLWMIGYPLDGYRHLMVLHPLLFLAFGLLTRKEYRQGVLLGPALVIALLLNLGAWWDTKPHHLAYINELGTMMTAEPFVFLGPDLDWGQNEYLLAKELSLTPAFAQKYINPYPSTVPLAGVIAINANNRMQRIFASVPAYDWLQLHRPYKTIGSTWLLYAIGEKDFRVQARALSDQNAQLSVLRFFMGRGAFEQVIKLGSFLQQQFFVAHRFIALAHIGRGDYEKALAECRLLESNEEMMADPSLIVIKVTKNLLGLAEGSDNVQKARALRLLYCSNMAIHKPIIDILRRDPLFNDPVTPHHKNHELRKVWALRHYKEGRFKSALAMFESLKGLLLHRDITFKLKKCREIVDLEKHSQPGTKARMALVKVCVGSGELGMAELQQLWQENRTEYFVLKHALDAMSVRRRICIPFRTGESMLFDQVSPSTGRWNDQKEVKKRGGS